MNTTFAINLSAIPLNPEGIILEQKDFSSGTGYTTKMDLVTGLYNNLYNTDMGGNIDCGIEENSYNSAMYVYPFNKELVFSTGLTWGNIGEGFQENITVTEQLQFSLDKEQTVKYPVQELISATWFNGLVWDSTGKTAIPPDITVVSNNVSLPIEVYGTVTVKYKTFRHVYAIDIPARDTSDGTAYQSVGYVWWNGGVKMLVLQPPVGAEEDEKSGVNCLGRSIVHTLPSDDLPVPPGEQDNTTILINYCLQQEM